MIGAGLVPLHHRLESLVITKLTSHNLNKETIVVAEKESSGANDQSINEDIQMPAAALYSSEANEVTPQIKSASAADATEAEDK